jgi:hypothetical protein
VAVFRGKSREKELKMVRKVRKGAKRSFLVGTAHFFPFSYRASLSRYVKIAHTVLFEGPLDEKDMAKVVNAGCEEDDTRNILDDLDTRTIDRITGALDSPGRERFPFLFFHERPATAKDRLYAMVRGMKPWMAFFAIWSKFLEKKGWRYSVDLEAYNIAVEMGKRIVFLETIEEQIEVLESLSHEKIVDFLKRVDRWDEYAQLYLECYLDGDLERLWSMRGVFPTRHRSVIDRRDRILFERMLPYLEEGDTVAFVGAPHISGISEMLHAYGYQIEGQYLNWGRIE